jgi:fibronectin type 3 domain-containing protein
MFKHHPNPRTVRAIIVAACLALLAGCGLPKSNPAAPVPTGLSATAGNAEVTLAWTASTGAKGYNVKRSTTSGGPYSTIASPTSAGYTDTTVSNGTTYYYVVSSMNTAGESMNSSQVSATPKLLPPAAPTNLAATAGSAQVSLTWTASSGATSYNVKRSTTSGGPYTQLATSTSASYTDSTVTNGTTYYYVVSAVNAAGESANSAEVSATPKGSAPPVPTNLAAIAGNAQVALTWTASSGATGYNVKRSTTTGGPYTLIASPTSTSYTDTTVTNGTTYYYVVSATNANGESANSSEISATPSATPPASGTWTNVTPSGVDLTDTLCSNFGAKTVQVDPVHPSNLYTTFDCQGVWKSTDYGVTWTGPINTGTNGTSVSACSGGITIAPNSTASVPTVYQACIRGGAGLGFWKSTDGGVDWTQITVTPTARQDYYPPVVDPYDVNHLLMAGHEFNSIVESTDGGDTWTSVNLDPGMTQNSDQAAAIFFIDTGNATTTRGTWLFIGNLDGGAIGTWRTTNSGAAWVQVDKNEHVGNTQIYQPAGSSVVYMTGNYSVLGEGVLRSADYGQTWTHVGTINVESVVAGTSENVYAMYGFPVGVGGSVSPAFEVAAQPGTGTWTLPGTPSALSLEGAAQITVVNDGTHNILLGAMWNSGVWRYVEP